MDGLNGGGDGGWAKTLRNFTVEAKRATERATVAAMKKVGISSSAPPGHDPDFDYLVAAYTSQASALRSVRSDAVAAFEALARTSSTGHSLAHTLSEALAANAEVRAKTAAESLVRAQVVIADEVLRRAEKRIQKRVLNVVEDEIGWGRETGRGLEGRKRLVADAGRYLARVHESIGKDVGVEVESLREMGTEDARKAAAKLEELENVSGRLRAEMADALPRRARIIEGCIAETIELQRRFFVDSARAMDRCVDAVGGDYLTDMRVTAEENSPTDSGGGPRHRETPYVATAPAPPGTQPSPGGAKSRPEFVDDDFFQFPVSRGGGGGGGGGESSAAPSASPPPTRKASSSIWDEDDGSDEDAGSPLDPFAERGSPPSAPLKTSSGSSGYPSVGVGARESAGGYPSAGVGQRESLYPPSRSRSTKPPPRATTSGGSVSSNSYTSMPSSKKSLDGKNMSRSASRDAGLGSGARDPSPSNISGDLLGELGGMPPMKQSRSKRVSVPAASSGMDDLMDFSTSASRTSTGSAAASAAPPEGDLLGAFSSPSAAPASRTSKPKPRSSAGNAANSRGSMSASSSAASGLNLNSFSGSKGANALDVGMGVGGSSSSTGGTENLSREQLKQQHEAEIKARAGEKLAAVRERETADSKERSQKDVARHAMEKKINAWTGNGTRRGNLRALLASLDSVIYPGSTWKGVNMDVLKVNAKVKINYHKAILQVHPDKIGPKNLPPDQQMLAELIFDELQNGYEVWTAEQEGKPPPPGSVGPKGAVPSGVGNPGFGRGGGMGNMSSMYAQQQHNFGRGGGMGFNPMGGMGGGMGGGFQQQQGMGGQGMGGMGMNQGQGMGMNQGMGSGLGRGMQAGQFGVGQNGLFKGGRGGNQQQRR